MKIEKIKEEIKEGLLIDTVDFDTEELIRELYNHESNYNNADKTTGMACYSIEDIGLMVDNILITLKEEDDRCNECGCLLSHYDIKGVFEPVNNSKEEFIINGYKCSKCGHEEDY